MPLVSTLARLRHLAWACPVEAWSRHMVHRSRRLRLIAVGKFVWMMALSWNAPVRLLMRRWYRQRMIIKGMKVYYGETGHSRDVEESELLQRAMRRLENDGELWVPRLSKHLRSVLLTHQIDFVGYWLADRSCLVSARTSSLF